MAHDALIARLEKAKGPDPELDEAIARLRWRANLPGASLVSWPAYTASIDSARTTVPNGYTLAVDATAPECGIDVTLFPPGDGDEIRATHDSEPIATLIAALRAASDQVRG